MDIVTNQNDDNDKLKLCVDYVKIVSKMFSAGPGNTSDLDFKRTEIHDALLEAFGLDALRVAEICSRLDIWLGFPNTEQAFTPSQVGKFGQRLYTLLTSDFLKNSSWTDVSEEYKRLRDAWYDDPEFDGWKVEE
jgi:hypothetical protein